MNGLKLKCVYIRMYTCAVSYLKSLRIPRGCFSRERETLPLSRIMESLHRASWRETVTSVKASSEYRQRRQNGGREAEIETPGERTSKGWSE